MQTTPPSASRTGVGVPGRRSAGVASAVAGGAATMAMLTTAGSCGVLCHMAVRRGAFGHACARTEASVHASDALEVMPHGLHDADTAVCVLDPLHRHLVEPQ